VGRPSFAAHNELMEWLTPMKLQHYNNHNDANEKHPHQMPIFGVFWLHGGFCQFLWAL
jgi:hypothetical protein